MLPSRIHHCFVIATMMISGIVSAGEPVVVELKSGRTLQAQTIEMDLASADRVVLTIQKPSLLMRRSVAWEQISRFSAPADQLASLQIPHDVEVANRIDIPERKPLVQPSSILLDGIPPAPSLEVPSRTSFLPANRSVACDCGPMFRDPGIVVGVRSIYPASPRP